MKRLKRERDRDRRKGTDMRERNILSIIGH